LTIRPLLRALALSVFPLAALLPALSTACGQDVAGCSAVCGTGATDPTTCASECDTAQTECAASNDGADFQALLTCISNANGVLDPLPVLCVPEADAVKANCTGTPPLDAGQ
jgi:hypothetical protein